MSVNNVTPANTAEVKKSRNVKESVMSGTAGVLATMGVGALGVPFMNSGVKLWNDLPQDKLDIIKQGVDNALEKSGVAAKGTKIERIALDPSLKISFIDYIIPNPGKQLQQGRNALFNPLFNVIALPDGKMNSAGFHEIGHAMNKNLSKVGKVLQQVRTPLMFLVGIPTLIGALSKTAKPVEGKELTGGQKTKNFIRDNAGKLSFAMMLPMLAEEAMASVKGNKLARELLNPELAKNVSKGNKIMYMTYLASALATGIGAWATVKIKDVLVAKKEASAGVQKS